ncbi:MAG TPA: hypothetical protein VK964_17260 [Nocardioidaceae bacterium]|nr:hypothetical protein [Nocardioidaceae bacterium]
MTADSPTPPAGARGLTLPALVAVVALLVGTTLGAVLVRGSAPDLAVPTPTEGVSLADEEVVRLVDATIAGLDAADVDAVSAVFAEDAVLTDLVDDRVTIGAYNIALAYGQTEDLRLRRTSDVVVVDGYVTFSVEDVTGPGLVVAEVEDGRFARFVVMAP